MKSPSVSTIATVLAFFSSISNASNNFDNIFNAPGVDVTPESALSYSDPNFASMDSLIVEDSCDQTFGGLQETNRKVRPLLKELINTDYFKYFKVDLYGRECPFFENNGMCFSEGCSVQNIDDLPESIRNESLGNFADNSIYQKKKNQFKESHVLDLDDNTESSCLDDELDPSQEDPDKDYCLPEDFSLEAPGVYVSLPDNPERFTGYGGNQSFQVWGAIYQENCFREKWNVQVPEAARPLRSVLDDFSKNEKMKQGLDIGDRKRDLMNEEAGQCLEKRVFYRIISGMHASISTHLCNEWFDPMAREWGPNMKCFMTRVGNFPDRLSNIYFNYALVSRAILKLRDHIGDIVFCSQNAGNDQDTRRQLLKMVNEMDTPNQPHFNEDLLFSDSEGVALKDEFRLRFRNVSAIMDCVACDRCRMWGKVQTLGYGTALKILFEDDEEISINRIELVGLINTFDRLSKSINSIENFRKQLTSDIYATQLDEEKESRFSNLDGTSDHSTEEYDEYEDYDDEVFEEAESLTDDDRSLTDKLKDDFSAELQNTLEAFKFILRSYIDFPANLWKLTVIYSNQWWNKLIGRDLIETHRKNIYKVDL